MKIDGIFREETTYQKLTICPGNVRLGTPNLMNRYLLRLLNGKSPSGSKHQRNSVPVGIFN